MRTPSRQSNNCQINIWLRHPDIMTTPTVDGRRERTMQRASILRIFVAAALVAIAMPAPSSADENCCFNNFRFAGGCMVVARGSESCTSIQSYLNSFDSVGKYYCDNTTVRGGWTLSDCQTRREGHPGRYSPQTQQPPVRGSTASADNRRRRDPECPPGARTPPSSRPRPRLNVLFDSDLDTSKHGAGQMVTGTLQEDLMSGDQLIAPAGSQVHAQLVPTSYWGDGSGSAFEIQATGVMVGDQMLPVSATAIQAHVARSTLPVPRSRSREEPWSASRPTPSADVAE